MTTDNRIKRLAKLEAKLEANGGRGIALAEEIDDLRQQVAEDRAAQINAELTNIITLTTHIVGMPEVTTENAKLFWFRNMISCRLHDMEPGFTYMDLLTHLPLKTHATPIDDDTWLTGTLVNAFEKLACKIGIENPYYSEED